MACLMYIIYHSYQFYGPTRIELNYILEIFTIFIEFTVKYAHQYLQSYKQNHWEDNLSLQS